MIRAIRFAARFGFEIEPTTFTAIKDAAASINEVSAERLGNELIAILTQGNTRRAFELMNHSGLLAGLLPEIEAMKGCDQNADHHPEGDVFVHTMLCLQQLERDCSPTLALGVLLHDVAKPTTAAIRDGRHTFYGHTREGGAMAEDIGRRLRLSNSTIERVRFLVEQHLRHCDAVNMKPSTLKRFLRQDGIDELMELARIDAGASSGDLSHYRFCTDKLAELGAEKMRPAPLVTGHDLIALGMTPGPSFKRILERIEDAQLEGRIGSRDEALELARALQSESR
jgi:poly(A) polymerase